MKRLRPESRKNIHSSSGIPNLHRIGEIHRNRSFNEFCRRCVNFIHQIMMSSRTSLGFFRILAASIIVASLTGCAATTGLSDSMTGESKFTPAFVKANIVEKKSTPAEVKQRLGAPYKISKQMSRGQEVETWEYRRQEQGVGGAMAMIHKYLPAEASLKMYRAEANAERAHDATNDAKTVTGAQPATKVSTYDVIVIYFANGVVDYYRMY